MPSCGAILFTHWLEVTGRWEEEKSIAEGGLELGEGLFGENKVRACLSCSMLRLPIFF